MSRSFRIIVSVVVVVVIVVIAGVGYLYVSGGSGAPSATLSAPTLAVAAAPTNAPTAAASAEAVAQATEPAAATEASGLTVFNIVTDQSKVSFTLNEVLNGSPNKVVGTTNQVAGQIGVDFTHPENSQVGEIKIDARTLATDSSMRDRMIRGQILQSAQDQYEFVSYQPSAITGLPASVTLQQPFSFQIAGDLTIRTITKPVTFDVTVTPDSQTKLEGTATATVQRDDFSLTIPNVPQVASVDQAVKLEIDFTATSAS